jgi:hypothetical protein
MYGNYTKNDKINQLGFICGTLDHSKTSNLPLRGSVAGSYSFTTLCPKSAIVKYVMGRTGSLLDQIQLDCGYMDVVIY